MYKSVCVCVNISVLKSFFNLKLQEAVLCQKVAINLSFI